MRRAADHLAVAPSAISRQIARIELAYGFLIFERRPGGIAITDQGRRFLETAGLIVRSLSDFEAALAQSKEQPSGWVKLHTIEGVTRSFLAPLIAQHRLANPNTTVSLVVAGRKVVLAAVEDYEADIGIVYDHFSSPTIETVAQWKQPLLAFARPSHPLFSKPGGTRDPETWPCAVPDQTFGIRRLVDRVFRARGIALAPVVVANQLQSLLHAAIESDLVTYMPLQAARSEVERGLLVPVPTGFAEFDHRFVSVIAHSSRPRAPHVSALLAAIRDAIPSAELADRALLSRLA